MSKDFVVSGPLRRVVNRHASPVHPGTGTEQAVHAGNGGAEGDGAGSTKAERKERLHKLYRKAPEMGSLRRSSKAQELLEAGTAWFLDREVKISMEEIDSISHARGLVLRDDSGNELTVQAGESQAFARNLDQSELVLSWISANNTGTGLGSAFMRASKSYADAKKMPFRIIQVTNPQFYRRFDWLDEIDSSEFVYDPSKQTVLSPVKRAEDEDYDLTESPHGPDGKNWPPKRPAKVDRHYGPGAHPGTGSPQQAHAGGRAKSPSQYVLPPKEFGDVRPSPSGIERAADKFMGALARLFGLQE